jgi:hypothetical protein
MFISGTSNDRWTSDSAQSPAITASVLSRRADEPATATRRAIWRVVGRRCRDPAVEMNTWRAPAGLGLGTWPIGRLAGNWPPIGAVEGRAWAALRPLTERSFSTEGQMAPNQPALVQTAP